MVFSHHSHSGQFCGHAANTLEEVIQDAISKGMHTFCLTEHIPRELVDFYPEEVEVHNEASLIQLFDDYHREAARLKAKYRSAIAIHIGFEGEWIRPSTLTIIERLFEQYDFDLFIGSVHHTHTVPIDFDHDMYRKARDIAGGSDEKLFVDYFDTQLEMLKVLQPPIVGHFDLIRLKSDDPERSFKQWPEVWQRIVRNLQYIASYQGILELNSASLRKGMTEPYPKAEICQEFLQLGGRFTLSDDSHGTEQVGLNYVRTLEVAAEAGIRELCYLVVKPVLSETHALPTQRFRHMSWNTTTVNEILATLRSNA